MRFVLTSVVLAVSLGLGCSSDTCTEIGCSSSASISGQMTNPGGPVSVQACRNGACSELTAADAEGCHSVNQRPQLKVCFEAGTAATEIAVTVFHDGDDPALADGDVYTLKVDDSQGASLVDFTGTATYSEHRPNGTGCDPVCKSAELSL